jgi:hypothetical protein
LGTLVGTNGYAPGAVHGPIRDEKCQGALPLFTVRSRSIRRSYCICTHNDPTFPRFRYTHIRSHVTCQSLIQCTVRTSGRQVELTVHDHTFIDDHSSTLFDLSSVQRHRFVVLRTRSSFPPIGGHRRASGSRRSGCPMPMMP